MGITINIKLTKYDLSDNDQHYKFISNNRILLGETDNEWYVLEKIEYIKEIERDKGEIPRVVNAIIDKVKGYDPTIFKDNEIELNILINHQVINSDQNWYWEGKLVEDKFYLKNGQHGSEIGKNLPNKFQNINSVCTKHIKPSIKTIKDDKNFIYHVIIISNQLAQSETWQDEIVEKKWGFESCTEDEEKILELFKRAKKLNRNILIFYHGALEHKFITKLVEQSKINKNKVIIESFHHIEKTEPYESFKIKDVKKIKTILINQYKNRIIYHWLPLAIDIQGLSEIKDDPTKVNRYWEEIVEGYESFPDLLSEHNKMNIDIEDIEDIIAEIEKFERFLNELEDNRKEITVDKIKGNYLDPQAEFFFPKWLNSLAQKLDSVTNKIEKN